MNPFGEEALNSTLPVFGRHVSRFRPAHAVRPPAPPPPRPAARHTSTASHPHALPTPNYYERFPHRVGAMGNVVVASKEELELWLLVARPVSREEAEEHGGCIMYTPTPTEEENVESGDVRYYCITDIDDEVYGRATYTLLSEPFAFADDSCSEAGVREVFTNAFEECDCDLHSQGETAVVMRDSRKWACRCPARQCCCVRHNRRMRCCGGG